jgi:hypothetical protein
MEEVALRDGPTLDFLELATMGMVAQKLGVSGSAIASRYWDVDSTPLDVEGVRSAIKNDDVAALSQYINNSFAANYMTDDRKYCFVTLAAGMGSINSFEYLIEHGAVPDGVCPYVSVQENVQRSGLACMMMNLNCVMAERLVEMGANVELPDSHLQATPLYHLVSNAAYWGELLDKGDVDEAKYSSKMEECKRLINRLIEAGADINARNGSDGFWPLAIAIQDMGTDPQIAIHLIEKGADLSLETSEGETALGLARKHGRDAIGAALSS